VPLPFLKTLFDRYRRSCAESRDSFRELKPAVGDSERVSRLLALKAKALELKNAVQEKLRTAEGEGKK